MYSISGMGSTDSNYPYVDKYVLEGTYHSLNYVLNYDRLHISNYSFRYDGRRYSILGLAILLQEASVVSRLVDLGANLSHGNGTVLHLYMDCLKQHISPNLQILNLLLDKVDINKERPHSDHFCTPLECAVATMALFNPIHWEVIETLLQRGAAITPRNDPFLYLKKAFDVGPFGSILRSHKDEKIHLDNLLHYLVLEKKYFPNSNRFLTVNEFILFTSNFRTFFRNMAIHLDTPQLFSLENLHGVLRNDNSPEVEVIANRTTEAEIQALRQTLKEESDKLTQQRQYDCHRICTTMLEYHGYFSGLVRHARFKECFQETQVYVLLRFIEEYPSEKVERVKSLFAQASVADFEQVAGEG